MGKGCMGAPIDCFSVSALRVIQFACSGRKASLGQALDQLHNMANAASRKREASDSWAIFKANTRIAQALAMFVPRKRMPKVDLDFILAWCELAFDNPMCLERRGWPSLPVSVAVALAAVSAVFLRSKRWTPR